MIVDSHDELVGRLLADMKHDPQVVGVMLLGSVARRDHSPGSDLDLLVLTVPGHTPTFRAEQIGSIWVERHLRDSHDVQRRLSTQPRLAYGFLDGQILHDPQGELAHLVICAEGVLASYAAAPQAIEDLRYWLSSTKRKILASQRSGDSLKTAFLVATNSWKILEGLWAVNDQPTPPSGTVLGRIGRLAELPEHIDRELERLFLGMTEERVASAVGLIDWVLRRLPSPSA